MTANSSTTTDADQPGVSSHEGEIFDLEDGDRGRWQLVTHEFLRLLKGPIPVVLANTFIKTLFISLWPFGLRATKLRKKRKAFHVVLTPLLFQLLPHSGTGANGGDGSAAYTAKRIRLI
ncbi:LOW QUALITY PROTEIN: hypothetical protein GX51_06918 [Blastomyces parvus]|uniref:Uncharacterized protein n=1 Tax=Blastomyces parvus TaxID=2060905 RepID=A0A2B7WP29_9EURO|nr:LOW QUALITY PROTEIN: hypothetical protein GX51_06918 [Blastomyces parvus]